MTILETEEGRITYNVCNGLPQGDVNSQTLFNIYTSSFHRLNDLNTTVV